MRASGLSVVSRRFREHRRFRPITPEVVSSRTWW
jgi:hypothetical protein